MSDSVVRFYRIGPGDSPAALPALSKDVSVRVWHPGDKTPGPEIFMGRAAGVYLGFHRLGIFSSGDYAALCLDRDGVPVHISTVFPRFFRFPFMTRQDLQIGATFTREDARGQGLAKFALAEAVHRLKAPGRAFWYLTKADNLASCAVAEAAGFACVGEGERVPRMGIKALGAYRLTKPLSPQRAARHRKR